MIIDLRSDTFTKPSPEMKEAMFSAEVGDDVFGEDPTVNKLEEFAANMFGMEAGLFCSSGTQTNQIAINVHTQPGDDVLCDQYAHIRYYEGGGIAANSGCSVTPLPGKKGILSAELIKNSIKPDDPHFPRTQLVALENTSNKGGGTIYSLDRIQAIRSICKDHKLAFHLDGARVFNAIVESDYSAKDLGNEFDSISVCLSKGLGAPVGSVLLGSRSFIHQARRIRKRFGGGMRQAGLIAAGGIFALQNNIDRLKQDHHNALAIASLLQSQNYVESVEEVETNIVMINIHKEISPEKVLTLWEKNGVKALALSEHSIRLVTHLDVSQQMVDLLQAKFAIDL